MTPAIKLAKKKKFLISFINIKMNGFHDNCT